MNRINYTPATYSSGKLANLKLGPAMTELNPRERALVDYILETGTDNFTEACLAVGYGGTRETVGPTASRKRRDPRIQAAIVEVGRQLPALGLPMAMRTITHIASDTSHKDALRAALALAGMSGISPITKSVTETTVVHHLDPLAAIEAKLAMLPPEIAATLRDQLMPPRQMIDITPPMLTHEEADELLADLL